jgi:hypothetical protein
VAMFTGDWLYAVLIALALWFALLCRTTWKLLRKSQPDHEAVRSRVTIAGIGFAAMAVGALLLVHLSWISPGVSQRLGAAAVVVLSYLLFGSTVVALLLSLAGLGKIRLLGIGTSLVTGFWWLTLAFSISMAVPVARHPTNFLVPEGYVGWVEVKYVQWNEPALKRVNGKYICRIPANGLLKTSSPLEQGWAKDDYFYYAEDGSTHALGETGWGGGGMIWGWGHAIRSNP